MEIRVSLLHAAGQAPPSSPEPSADSAAVVAAAVGAHAGQRDDYDVFHVVDHLGRRPVTPEERAGVEAALAPGVVDWVADLRAVVGDQATIAERQAVVTVSEPVIDGSVAEITVELWCGMTCAGALTYLLERSPYGVWSVIGTTGGWVS
jgi:hypothetical protein